jgi:hypothetical protein
MNELRRRWDWRSVDGREWAVDLLFHLSDCGAKLLPPLPPLRRSKQVVGSLRTNSWSEDSLAAWMALPSGTTLRRMLDCAEATPAELTGWLACAVHP